MNRKLTIWSYKRNSDKQKRKEYEQKENVPNSIYRCSRKGISKNTLQNASKQENTSNAKVPNVLAYELQGSYRCSTPFFDPMETFIDSTSPKNELRLYQNSTKSSLISNKRIWRTKRKRRHCCKKGFVEQFRRIVEKRHIEKRHLINDKRLGVIKRGRLFKVFEIWKSYGTCLARVQQDSSDMADEMIFDRFSFVLGKNIASQARAGSKLMILHDRLPIRVERESIYMQPTKVFFL